LETNISFVVEGSSLRKALNVIHDSFFLSEYNVLNLFICGVGTVGGRLIEQIRAQYGELKRKRRLKLNVVGIANSTHAIFNRDGIDLDGYADMLRNSEHSDITRLRNEIVKMNIFNSVFVDCTASKDVAQIYQDLLEHNISVVAANKTAASADYESYTKLKQTALARGVKFRFETNVGAGLPIIGTINDLRYSGDRILHIEAVLSGTLNFIFNEIAAGTRMSEAVRHAKEQGYSEPDPRVDLSGIDVVRKIVILTREAGYKIGMEDVKLEPLMPSELFEGHLDDFWKQLPDIDDDFERRRLQAGAEGKRLRFVAEMDKGQARVSLRAIGKEHPFYNLEGSNNIVMLTTERYKEYPMLIQGYGAGAGVTAAGVFANILSIANV
jgi:aspartokinase/homoserine dehydrogenase 1